MSHDKITDQSPVIRLPLQSHRKAKALAALRGTSLRDTICGLIDQAWARAEMPGNDSQRMKPEVTP